MKKNKIRRNIVSRSNFAVAFYYVQLAIMSPILIPILLIQLVCSSIIECWGNYKDWYLTKTLRRYELEETHRR